MIQQFRVSRIRIILTSREGFDTESEGPDDGFLAVAL